MKVQINFTGDKKGITHDKKRATRKKIIQMLAQFSIEDITIPGWTILELEKKTIARNERVRNLDFAIYSEERIDSLDVFGALDPHNNYFVGSLKSGGHKYLYLVELGEFIHSAGRYALHLPRQMNVKFLKIILGRRRSQNRPTYAI